MTPAQHHLAALLRAAADAIEALDTAPEITSVSVHTVDNRNILRTTLEHVDEGQRLRVIVQRHTAVKTLNDCIAPLHRQIVDDLIAELAGTVGAPNVHALDRTPGGRKP